MSIETPSREPRHPIRVVADRTGLSPSVLRAWERRYGVVAPDRTGAGQRLYSDADVERIALLAKAAAAGRSVGRIAQLSLDQLQALVTEDAAHVPARPTLALEYRERAFTAVAELRTSRLQTILRSAVFSLGAASYLEDVAAPLLRRIGDAWHAGEIGIAHEHAASAVMRGTLEWLTDSLDVPDDAPVVVLACPAHERHELGAMLAAGAATQGRWRVVFLGADIPATEVAGAARDHAAAAVGMSVIAPGNPAETRAELRTLRNQLPPTTALLAGGAGLEALGDLGPGITAVRDLAHWRSLLRIEAPPG